MNEYVVASFTHGQFIADPPGCWTPRQQDELVIFRLVEVQP